MSMPSRAAGLTGVPLLNLLPAHKVLSLGVDRRPQHLEDRPERRARLAASRWPQRLGEPPVDRAVVLAAACAGQTWQRERSWTELKSWLAFALQKLDELRCWPCPGATAACA
jgi:5-methyltetrahydropteroyltriglutamate--homocysteine methyltransferase